MNQVPELVLVPGVGAGDVKFGLSASEVRAALGLEADSFEKGGNPNDLFMSVGLMVQYGPGDKCEFVDCAPPADPVVLGHRLLERSMG